MRGPNAPGDTGKAQHTKFTAGFVEAGAKCARLVGSEVHEIRWDPPSMTVPLPDMCSSGHL